MEDILSKHGGKTWRYNTNHDGNITNDLIYIYIYTYIYIYYIYMCVGVQKKYIAKLAMFIGKLTIHRWIMGAPLSFKSSSYFLT